MVQLFECCNCAELHGACGCCGRIHSQNRDSAQLAVGADQQTFLGTTCFSGCYQRISPSATLLLRRWMMYHAQPVATCGDTDSTTDGAQPYVCDASKGLVPKPDAGQAGPPNDTICCLVSGRTSALKPDAG
jgi:hypothetical protein